MQAFGLAMSRASRPISSRVCGVVTRSKHPFGMQVAMHEFGVRFLDRAGCLDVLEVHCPDLRPATAELERALRAADVRIVSVESRVERGVLRERLRVSDSEGLPLCGPRRSELEWRVFTALEPRLGAMTVMPAS
jgi:hypothetical protein